MVVASWMHLFLVNMCNLSGVWSKENLRLTLIKYNYSSLTAILCNIDHSVIQIIY